MNPGAPYDKKAAFLKMQAMVPSGITIYGAHELLVGSTARMVSPY